MTGRLEVEKQSPFAVASEASSAGGAVRLLQDLRHRHLPSDPRRFDRMEGVRGEEWRVLVKEKSFLHLRSAAIDRLIRFLPPAMNWAKRVPGIGTATRRR